MPETKTKPKKKPAKTKLAKRKIAPRKKRVRRPTHPAKRYIHDVLTGRQLVCKWVRLAVERHVRDLENGHKRELWFDEEDAQYTLDFYALCPYVEGREWVGKRIEPMDFQAFAIWVVFGWKRADPEKPELTKEEWPRRFTESYESMARKNGKSTQSAPKGLYLAFDDNEPGAQVYSAATIREQACIIHDFAAEMVKKSPDLRRRIKSTPSRHTLYDPETNSKFQALGKDLDTMDGKGPHGALIDEVHALKNGKIINDLKTGRGALFQPLLAMTTTRGSDVESICYEMDDYACKVLEGIIEDDSFFAIIYTLDEGDDWRDEKVWPKANPALGVFLKLQTLRSECLQAQASARLQNDFRRKRTNQWTETTTVWISDNDWMACNTPLDMEFLKGRECCGGLDLSVKLDLTAFVLAFKLPLEEHERPKVIDMRKARSDDQELELFEEDLEALTLNLNFKIALLPFFYIPEARMQKRITRDRVPYDVWAEQGLINVTPGNTVDYDFIYADIKRNIAPLYAIQEIAFDGWSANQLYGALKDGIGGGREDFMVEHGQGYKSMSEPTKTLEALVMEEWIVHGGHAVLRWCIANTSIATDPAGNIKPVKPSPTSPKRIDGTSGSVMSIRRVILAPEPAQPAFIYSG